jgi:hypothetical protein
MSRYGLNVARQHAAGLAAFDSLEEAERLLYEQRDAGLRELQDIQQLQGVLDYSPESLKSLEQWFFETGQPATTITGYSISRAVGFYLGEVFCRYGDFNWIVRENPFGKGTYEVGVTCGLMTLMLTQGRPLTLKGNKLRLSLWREFTRYTRKTSSQFGGCQRGDGK